MALAAVQYVLHLPRVVGNEVFLLAGPAQDDHDALEIGHPGNLQGQDPE